jgi:signal transduction histidine kinase
MKSGFIDKLLERINRVSPDEMQAHLARLLEERGLLENVFQALQEGVLLLDPQGIITYLNAAAAGLFGMDEQEAPGQPLGKYIKGLDWKALVASGGSVNRDLEVSYPENRYLNFYLAPFAPLAEDLPARGYVMLVRDITRTRRMTEEKIESERLSVLTMLAAGVAHELGNPLNSLTIHLQLLDRKLKARDSRLHQELSPFLETARGELERLDFIIEEFLQAVRPSRPRVEAADLNALLREAVQFLALELKEKNHEIALELHSHLPPMAVDPGQMKQAIYNVLRNASQAMEPEGKITVRSDYDNHGVVITVADNGPGIGSEDMARLFTPYFTTKSRGHGLGLLIVRRILREHGGDIRIESREGHGTTVCLHLPFATPRVHLLAAPEGVSTPTPKPARGKRKPRTPAPGKVIDLDP